MAHKKNIGAEIVKTYSFKVKNTNGITMEKLMNAIDEYQSYYNLCSDWICKNLTTMTIGDLDRYIPEKAKDNIYATVLLDEVWKNQPLYKIFGKKYSSNNRNNALYCALSSVIDMNKENVLGFSKTHYVRNGYILNVISNYASKLSKLNTGVKSRAIKETSDEATIIEQVIYEMEHNKWESIEDWKNQIEYLNSKTDYNPTYMERMKTLSAYYSEHKSEVDAKMQEMAVENLVKFGGCRRNNSKKSMFIMGSNHTNYTISYIGDNCFNINFANILNFDVYGRRDVVKNGEVLVDIMANHGDSIVLKIVNGELYADVPCSVTLNKVESNFDKVVGIDVNMKHMLLSTSVTDNGSSDFLNIYKEMSNNAEFMALCPEEDRKYYKDISQYVTFAPLELDLLFSRISKQGKVKMEKVYSEILEALKWKFFANGDNKNRIYVENIQKIRQQIKALCVIKNAYYEQQSAYDIGKTQEYIEAHPFSLTEKGMSIKSKMDNICRTIIGCRNNIIDYAYSFFERNDYSIIGLEKLTSSQFEKTKSLPTCKFLLNFHKVLGHTLSELETLPINDVVKKGYYTFTTDNEGRITDASLSEKGKVRKMKDDFFNQAIKAIHFADVKDYFATLSNNGQTGIFFVPSQFTSQMDSNTHTLYFENAKNGGLKLASKYKVRKSQEYHLNGLPADYNAARNIAYIGLDEIMRNTFLKKANSNKSLYNQPIYDTGIKKTAGVFSRMKKLKKYKVI